MKGIAVRVGVVDTNGSALRMQRPPRCQGKTINTCFTSQTWSFSYKNYKNGLVIGLTKARFNLPTRKSTDAYGGFADRLKQACDLADIPAGRARNKALSLRFDVSKEAVRQWFKGQAFPETARLAKVAEEFECSLDWLILGRLPSTGQIREPGGAYKVLTEQERTVITAMRKLNARRRSALVQLLADSES